MSVYLKLFMNHYLYLLSVVLSDKIQCNSRAGQGQCVSNESKQHVGSENYASLQQMVGSTLTHILLSSRKDKNL